MERQKETGATYVHPFDDYDVMAGQGTIAMETLRQEDRIDTFIVPIGGGGLISGIAVAAKHVNRNIKVIGVQTEAFPAAYNIFHGKSLSKHICRHDCRRYCRKNPGELTMPLINKYVDDIVTVNEEEIASAILYML